MSLKHIYSARDSFEAYHLRGLLESAGVEAVVLGDALTIARPEVPPTHASLPGVWVRQEDADVATAILAEWRTNRTRQEEGEVSSETWFCGSCGEEVEAQFTDCWNCGAEREESDRGGAEEGDGVDGSV